MCWSSRRRRMVERSTCRTRASRSFVESASDVPRSWTTSTSTKATDERRACRRCCEGRPHHWEGKIGVPVEWPEWTMEESLSGTFAEGCPHLFRPWCVDWGASGQGGGPQANLDFKGWWDLRDCHPQSEIDLGWPQGSGHGEVSYFGTYSGTHNLINCPVPFCKGSLFLRIAKSTSDFLEDTLTTSRATSRTSLDEDAGKISWRWWREALACQSLLVSGIYATRTPYVNVEWRRCIFYQECLQPITLMADCGLWPAFMWTTLATVVMRPARRLGRTEERVRAIRLITFVSWAIS